MKRRAALAGTLDPHEPADRVHDAAHDRETEAGAVVRRLCGHERLEDALLVSLLHTVAAVGDDDLHHLRHLVRREPALQAFIAPEGNGRRIVPSAAKRAVDERRARQPPGPEAELSARRHGVDGVEEEIRERLFELERRALHGERGGVEALVDRDAAEHALLAEEAQRVAQCGVDVGPERARLPGTRVVDQSVHHALDARDLALQGLHRGPQLGRDLVLERVRVIRDGAQRIAHFVREAGRDASCTGEALDCLTLGARQPELRL